MHGHLTDKRISFTCALCCFLTSIENAPTTKKIAEWWWKFIWKCIWKEILNMQLMVMQSSVVSPYLSCYVINMVRQGSNRSQSSALCLYCMQIGSNLCRVWVCYLLNVLMWGEKIILFHSLVLVSFLNCPHSLCTIPSIDELISSYAKVKPLNFA